MPGGPARSWADRPGNRAASRPPGGQSQAVGNAGQCRRERIAGFHISGPPRSAGPVRRAAHGSGGGPLVTDVVLLNGTTEYTEIDYNTSVCMRVKISGYSSSTGYNQQVRIKRVM